MPANMSFVDGITVIPADWLNNVNAKVNGTIGSVNAVAVVSANGFGGSVTGTTTQTITLTTSLTGLLKGDGTGMSAATAGVDYSAGTSGLSTGVLKSTTGTGALSIAGGADLPSMTASVGGAVPTPPNDNTQFLSGDGTWRPGTSSTGTVTSFSIVSANGFNGTVATATTTPALTLKVTFTGLAKGNGTALSAATVGTDYSVGTSTLSTGILKSTTATGALSIATGADLPAMSAVAGGAVPTPPNDSTQVLRGNATWGPQSSGSGLVLLDTQTASASATLDFTTSIDATYSEYEFHLINVIPATNNANLWLRTSANAGVSWDSATNSYGWTLTETVGNSVAATITSSNTAQQGQLTGNINNGSSKGGVSGKISLYNPAGTTSNKHFLSKLMTVDSSGVNQEDAVAYRIANAALNGVRFQFSSGVITAGVIKLYGVAK